MDPLLLNSEFGSVLILGKTGSGKSTLVHQACKIAAARKNLSFLQCSL